ncbi:MAG TPA: Holliday junction resolvase RuvX [Bacteroidia bacterium]|nr:Holliday junction resolvase RuvX [Bacteroidia bacterium]
MYNCRMKYLGVDYGEKNIGLAKSDSMGQMAFPLIILNNDNNIVENFLKILDEENIEKIIFGKSLNYQMEENLIHSKLEKFIIKIQEKIEERKISWDFENEVMTSMEARRGQSKNERRFKKEDRKKNRINMSKNIDDSAAALILKSYLDKKNGNFSF